MLININTRDIVYKLDAPSIKATAVIAVAAEKHGETKTMAQEFASSGIR